MKTSTVSALVLVCSSIFTFAQTSTPVPSKKPAVTAPRKSAEPKVAATSGGPDEAVITIRPACPKPAPGVSKTTPCRDKVTRGEFESIVKAANPGMAPAMKRSFASNLARMLAYSDEAARLDLQNSAEGKELLELARMQAMAQLLGHKYQGDAANVSPGEIQTYYRENSKKYEAAVLERILIPHKLGEADPKSDQAFAEQLRSRWAAGGDPQKLEKEAYDRTSNTTEPPPVKIGERRSGSLPKSHDQVFELKVGEISNPIMDATASYIYKVVSRSQVPLEQAQDEIKRTLTAKHLDQMVKELDTRATVTLNDSYFTPPSPPVPATPPAAKSAPEPAKEPPTVAPNAAPAPSAPPTEVPSPKSEKEPN